MKNRIFTIFLLLLLSFSAFAQERKVQNRPYIDFRRLHYGFFFGLHAQDFELANNGFVNADGERVTMPPCPVKIWQGTADATVDPLMVQEYVRSVKRAGCYIELRLLEGVGHTIHPVMEQEIVMWFNRFTDC